MIETALGEEFLAEEFHKQKVEKKGKGKKQCDNCGMYLAAATKQCVCGYVFFKVKKPKKSKRFKEIDWKTLEHRDIIYLESNDVWISPSGDMIPMGDNGEFTVIKVTTQGLLLHSSREGGYRFQNMVDTGYNKKTGITRGKAYIYKK